MTLVPEAVLIAGANGAGKTTFAREFLHVRYPGASFLNADVIQREGGELAHPLAAGRELIRRLGELVNRRLPFAVETTLSSVESQLRAPGAGLVGSRLLHDSPLHRAAVCRLRRKPRGKAGCSWRSCCAGGRRSPTIRARA